MPSNTAMTTWFRRIQSRSHLSWRMSSTCCCCLVDKILKLPQSSEDPVIKRYRRNWYSLSVLVVLLIISTFAQAIMSAINLMQCKNYLDNCLGYLKRDPCLKTAIPTFVASLVALSVFCSCCCQSSKALVVFLLVALLGETVLGGYTASFDRVGEFQQHLRGHLLDSVHAFCVRQAAPTELNHLSCWRSHQLDVPSCRVFDDNFFHKCNYSLHQKLISLLNKPEHVDDLGQAAYKKDIHNDSRDRTSSKERIQLRIIAKHLSNCFVNLEKNIEAVLKLYRFSTVFNLTFFAALHFILALCICVCDSKRKRNAKAIYHRPATCGAKRIKKSLEAVTLPLK